METFKIFFKRVLFCTLVIKILSYPGQKINCYSRDIHVDLQCDPVISCDIDFDLRRELVTRRYCGSRRCRTEVGIARYHMHIYDRTVDQPHEYFEVGIARYHMHIYDRTVDKPHEYFGSNDIFFCQGSRFTIVHSLINGSLKIESWSKSYFLAQIGSSQDAEAGRCNFDSFCFAYSHRKLFVRT